ncbi:MAG: 30S ribosomal protein S6, partial [Thermoguttaceae bacterium]|nr:30S ribosomal protein S6 [Thermoguttaceae bacterium]
MTQEHVYDGLFILNSEAYARNPEEVSGQIAKTIESLGGVVRVSRLWEERKLAYPIKNHRRGTYWLTYFRMQTDKLVELNRQFQLNGNVIRFLIQTIDPRLEDALVE